MGWELSLQAIPEDCELLSLARKNKDIAETLPFLHMGISELDNWLKSDEEVDLLFASKLADLLIARPNLASRYFYGGRRCYDIIEYLLCANRRCNSQSKTQECIIQTAIHGNKSVYPGVRSSQGISEIRLVSANLVPQIVEYMHGISYEQFKKHWNVEKMIECSVYKMGSGKLQWGWEEFQGMYQLYQQAQKYGEAVLATID